MMLTTIMMMILVIIIHVQHTNVISMLDKEYIIRFPEPKLYQD